MIILGIDPGFARMGWGVISSTGAKVTLVAYGCLETKAAQTPSHRLKTIYTGVTELIKKFSPSCAVIEDLFFNTNAKTAIRVGEARGAILIALENSKLSIFHYTPLQIKIAVTGYGRADKTQIQKMIKTLLNLDQIPRPDDAADALAAALTHAFSAKIGKLKGGA